MCAASTRGRLCRPDYADLFASEGVAESSLHFHTERHAGTEACGTPRAWQRAQCRCVPTRLEGAMLAAECFPRCTDPSIWPATAQAEQNCVPDLIRASSLAVLDTFEETRLQREQPQHRLLQLALSLQQL
ncbi:hypothetical protein MRX96_021342 [Rhipicephalus microplus]